MVAGVLLTISGAALDSQTGDQWFIPIWGWVALSLVGLFIAQFLAFHTVRGQREVLQKQLDRLRDELLGNLSLNRLHFGFGKMVEDEIEVQPGLYLLNSASIAVQYKVTDITAIVSNRAVSNPEIRVQTGIIQSGKERLFLYAVIPGVPKVFPTKCTIKYTVQYGPLTEGYTHELRESLTVTLNMSTAETKASRLDWVYLTEASGYRQL